MRQMAHTPDGTCAKHTHYFAIITSSDSLIITTSHGIATNMGIVMSIIISIVAIGILVLPPVVAP